MSTEPEGGGKAHRQQLVRKTRGKLTGARIMMGGGLSETQRTYPVILKHILDILEHILEHILLYFNISCYIKTFGWDPALPDTAAVPA